jgi:addiction module HigA family antidote
MTDRQPFSPDWVSPPGGTIEDLLEERGWTQAELGERLGFTSKHVNDLIHARAPLTPDAAERLSRVLGSTTDFWLVREAQYQAALKHQEAIEAAATHADWLDELPLAWMRKQGWARQLRNKGKQVLEALEFFGVASVDAWRGKYETPLTAFRASEKFEKKVGAVAAWLRRGELLATAAHCAPFDRTAFKGVLKDLRPQTAQTDPAVFAPALIAACASVGVAVVFVPAPPGCPASGATRWLTPTKAMLVLSLRHKSNDHLWFTFFHEAGHLLLHGKKMLFIDGLDGLDGEHEEEANAFARDFLIPPAHASRLEALARRGKVSKREVRSFAQEVGVAPGIVVGRMQNEGWLPWTHMNDLKVRYQWTTEGGEGD